MDFDTARFIEEIKTRPAIWNSIDTQYDKRQKITAWGELIEIYGGNFSVAEQRNLETCLHKKWRNIRDCFVKAHKAKELNTKKQAPYSYYENLLFLKDTLPKYTKVVLEGESDESSVPVVVKRAKRKRKFKNKDTGVKNLNHLLKAAAKYEEKQPDQQIDRQIERQTEKQVDNETEDDRLFFLSLVKEFRKIPENSQIQAKVDILKVIKDAQSPIPCKCDENNPLNIPIDYHPSGSYMMPMHEEEPHVMVKIQNSSESSEESQDS